MKDSYYMILSKNLYYLNYKITRRFDVLIWVENKIDKERKQQVLFHIQLKWCINTHNVFIFY